jgi:trimethylguanosine synthase
VFKAADVESCAPLDAEGDPLLEWWLMMQDDARGFAREDAEAAAAPPLAQAGDALEAAVRATRALGLDAVVATDGDSIEVAGGVALLRREGPGVAVDCAHADLRARLQFELLGVPLPQPPSSSIKEHDTTASHAPAKRAGVSSAAKSSRGGAHRGSRGGRGGKVPPAASQASSKQQPPPPGEHCGALAASPPDAAFAGTARQPTYKGDAQHDAKYKVKLCLHFEASGQCPFGTRCFFAHGEAEPQSSRSSSPSSSSSTQPPQQPPQQLQQREAQQQQQDKEQTPEHELGVLRHVGTLELANGGCTFVTEVALAKFSEHYRPTGKSTSNKANLVPAHFADVPRHYFTQRYRFFSRFDKGIQMDSESWHSVTPEAIAEHIAERCRASAVLDAFAGCGGNAIQFAFSCERVIAVEIDPGRLAIARNNAEVYGVADRIEFILGDSVRLLRALADKGPCAPAIADCIFLSPPWGGPEYQKAETFDLRSIKVGGIDGCELFSLATRVSPNVAYFVPRNTDPKAASELLLAGGAGRLEFERHVVEERVKTCCIYSGDLLAMRTLGLHPAEQAAHDLEREVPDGGEDLLCECAEDGP